MAPEYSSMPPPPPWRMKTEGCGRLSRDADRAALMGHESSVGLPARIARKDLSSCNGDRLTRREFPEFDGDGHVHQRVGLVNDDHGPPLRHAAGSTAPVGFDALRSGVHRYLHAILAWKTHQCYRS